MVMIQRYYIKNVLATAIVNPILNMRNVTGNLRNLQEFQSERKKMVKYSNNFFTVKIINNICPQDSILNIF